MLKRIALLFFAPIFLISSGFFILVAFDNTSLVPTDPDCGLSVMGPIAEVLPAETKAKNWVVKSWPGTATTPLISIAEHSSWGTKPAPTSVGGCKLKFKNISNSEARGVDWRIGKEFPAEHFRGRTIKTTFFIKAKKPANLPNGSIYSYDGKKVAGQGTQNIPQQWGKYEVVQKIGDDADVFEIWFRVVFDTPEATPSSNSISFAALIEEVNESAIAKKPVSNKNHKGETWSSVCQTNYNLISPIVDEKYINNNWTIYSYDADKPAPTVKIKNEQNGCLLDITDAPTSARTGIDWRMGKELGAKNVRGKLVTFNADLSSTPNSDYTSASIYFYDGIKATGQSFEKLDGDSRVITLTKEFPMNATAAEAWLRLVIGNGTITPEEVEIRLKPEITIN